MKNATLFCAMVTVAAFAGPADAIYKCTTAKGVVYQDRPCREGSETDVQIVIPTGELAPRNSTAGEDGVPADSTRVESRLGAPKPSRAAGDNPASTARPGDRKPTNTAANAVDESRKKESRASAENAVAPMTADKARKTDPSAKYYATETFGSGAETPAQMNCESPSGEKRVFYLSDGKLTSI